MATYFMATYMYFIVEVYTARLHYF